MIPNQTFHCPHCGAPGQIVFGQAEYSCHCRFNFNGPGNNPAGADQGKSSGEHIPNSKPLYKILEERGYQYRPPLPNDD